MRYKKSKKYRWNKDNKPGKKCLEDGAILCRHPSTPPSKGDPDDRRQFTVKCLVTQYQWF